MTAEPMACAVCARVLDAHGGPDDLEYRHVLLDQPADHPAVPVALDQVRVLGRCDFCSADDPRWMLPARTFALDDLVAPAAAVSVEAWAACDGCAPLIARNQWSALRRRVVALLVEAEPSRDPEAVSLALGRVWRRLRANVLGDPVPIQWQ